MKTKPFIHAGLGLVLFAGPLVAGETAASRLEKGVELMADESTLRDAIRQFEGVLRAERQSRKLAAEARYHLARCHVALGEEDEARGEIARLREGWPAENPWVIRAAGLLPEPSLFRRPTWQGGEFLRYDIGTPGGQTVGHLYSAIVASGEEGSRSWTAWTFRGGNGAMLSRIEFLDEDYRPVAGRMMSPVLGEVVLEMRADGSWRTMRPDSGEVLARGDAATGGWGASPVYDNDEVLHLMRLLPAEVGSEVSIPITTALMGGNRLDFELSATKHGTVEVAAGRFDCVYYESNLNQNFWVEREGARRIVRIEAGMAEIDLVSIDDGWDPEASRGLEARGLGFALELPAGLIATPVADTETVYRSSLVDAGFRIREGLIEIQPTSNFNPELRDDDAALMDSLVKSFGSKDGEAGDGRRQIEAGGRSALVETLQRQQGKIESARTVLVSHGASLTVVLRMDHAPGGAGEAEALLGAILGGLKEAD